MPEAGFTQEKGWMGSRALSAEKRRFLERCMVIVALSVLPIVAYLLSSLLLEAKGPYWLAENSDPEYAYLFNAVNVLQGRMPEHVDHPGTTLQVLGAAVIGVLTVGTSLSDVTTLVVDDPERYLSAINRTVRLLVVASQVAVGALCFALTRSMLAAWLVQFPLVSSTYVLESLGRVSPEPLILVAVTVLSAVVLIMLGRQTVLSETLWGYVLAIICGFGIATKLTFIPVLAFPLVILKNLLSRAAFVLSTVLFTVVFTVPIIPKYPDFLTWTTNLLVRSGHYGTGESDFIRNFWRNLHDVLFYQPSLSLLLVFVMIVVAVASRHCSRGEASIEQRRLLRVAVGLMLFHGLQLCVVAKHPGSIAYLMPSIGLSGLTIVVAIMLWKELQIAFPVRIIASGLMLLALIWTMAGQEHRWRTTLDEYGERRIAAMDLERLRDGQFSGCLTVFYYRASSKVYAEYFGAEFSGRQVFGPHIRRVAGPQGLFYQVWSKRLFSSEGLLVDMQKVVVEPTGCAVFQGTPFEGDYARFRPALAFTDRCGGKREALYVIGRHCHASRADQVGGERWS